MDKNKSHAFSDYSIFCHDNLVIFEFFMPLTNETKLRNSLDAIFYKDFVLKRLKSTDIQILKQYFTKDENQTYEEYLDNICDWISTKFNGYSISHVSGRYRGKDLCSLHDAYHYIEKGESYLVDETTAVAKFIFPCGENRIVSDLSFEPDPKKDDDLDLEALQREYRKIRFLFFKLFIQNITLIVNEEDEIWMMESGMRHRLYSWRVESVPEP
ncbi:MAG: hypothetical protein JEY99_17860 [Spirochaetales bacterium]|nr:hypothetical protein [Spirochaetales bacterium]